MTNTAPAPKKKKRLSMHQKQSLAGWAFLMPATLLIFIMSFYPMFSALLTSFKRGKPTALVWSEPLWRNYQFMLKDKVFIQSVTNTLTYLIIQVDHADSGCDFCVHSSTTGISNSAACSEPASSCRARRVWSPIR